MDNTSVVEFPLYLKSVGQVLNFALLRLECPDTKSNMLIKMRQNMLKLLNFTFDTKSHTDAIQHPLLPEAYFGEIWRAFRAVVLLFLGSSHSIFVLSLRVPTSF